MKEFKPQLLPNNLAGEAPNWEERIEHPEQWLYSNKLDGARVELSYDTPARGRSLKVIPNVQIQRMNKEVCDAIGRFGGMIEAEFYSEEMNFSEIMHFFKTEDVTSYHTVEKYNKLWNKTLGDPKKGWPYPNRDVIWLTTWHDSLKFHVFDYCLQDNTAKLDRTFMYYDIIQSTECSHLIVIKQCSFYHLDELYQAFDQAIMDGSEGLVLIHKNSEYKYGRHTLKSKQAFKIKDDNLEFDGVILSVEEATEAREGSARTTNELGRSVTSKLKEDRVPNGMAKGFLVEMEDGNKLTVSLKNYNHPARTELLVNQQDYVGRTIRFTGMAPVKAGGCPRHAHFTRGNFRDDK